ncbi:MAG: peptide-methionine (S)-S-oxide reductase MsrA [Armatimonadota bacterium]
MGRLIQGGLGVIAAATLVVSVAFAGCAYTAAQDEAQPQATQTTNEGSGEREMATETATFGAGCFWGVEERFRTTPGVTDTEVGYAGGQTENPTYKQVCSHATGHAEVVQLQYDPEQISYEELLRIFFEMHDPTQIDRQGPDVGDQYRSVIFYHTDEQKQAAEAMKAELDEGDQYSRPIATTIQPAPKFWPAEDYHQEYFKKRGGGGCLF